MKLRWSYAMAACLLAGFSYSASSQASTYGYYDYVGDHDGYTVYDYSVFNGGSESIDFLNHLFRVPSGGALRALHESGTSVNQSDALVLNNSYFTLASEDMFHEALLLKLGVDSNMQTADTLTGFFLLKTPIGTMTSRRIARLAISGSSIQNVAVQGWQGSVLDGASPLAKPQYGFVGSGTSGPYELALPGDTDLSGGVDFDDLGRLLNAYGQDGSFETGDADIDGDVDFDDLGMLLNNYGKSLTANPLAPEPAAHMPEPLTMATLGLAGLAVWRKARKRFAA